jgi:hypothetical protein
VTQQAEAKGKLSAENAIFLFCAYEDCPFRKDVAKNLYIQLKKMKNINFNVDTTFILVSS